MAAAIMSSPFAISPYGDPCSLTPDIERRVVSSMDKTELVVVTGGAGFIGSHLVEALLGEGYRVRVVDNLATGHHSNLAHLDGYDWFLGDVSDFETCRRAVEGAAYVFHQAAI